MDELGIIIYKDGERQSFGKYVPADDPRYQSTPNHDEAFIKEILPSFQFKLNELEYDSNTFFYKNAVNLANQGVIMILNKDGGILAYVPANPTSEQINSILEDQRLNSITDQEVAQFVSGYDPIDYDPIEYSSLKEYALSKADENNSNKSIIA